MKQQHSAQRGDRRDSLDADAAAVAGEPLPSERVPLNRDRIVDAAVAYIDASGLPGLSMRRLGAALGVEAMSLYGYLSGKEELLDAVVERLVQDMRSDEGVFSEPRENWQDFLQRMAHGVRRIALAHPKAFPLVASRPPEAPWLRPPLRSLEWVETFLSGLTATGFSDDAAIAAYRAFTSFLLGHLLLEVASLGADLGPLDVLDESDRPEDLPLFPTVKRLRGGLTEDHSSAEFEEALEDLLNRLALILAEDG